MWPLSRKTPPSPKPAKTQGAEAHADAREHLAAQRARQPEVSRVAASLRELRERNHFAAQIREIFMGGTLDERN